ncbi:hypothetical protein [Neisseria animalis]|nr:hypothetical protein [Neisseria animalis]
MDKFVWAMAIMAVILAVIIGGGFVATEYVKKHPELFEIKPQK